MKRRIVLIALALVLALALCACGTTTDPADSNGSSGNNESVGDTSKNEPVKTEFNIGETWTVDGQWSLVVNSVTATEDRNEFAETNPAAVYVVDYTYTNIGYTDQSGLMDGLFFGMDDSIVDCAGVMGYSYPGDVTKYANEAPVGATCNAQSCVGVDNAGTFKINVVQYDGNGNKQTATFIVNVPEN